MMNRVFCVLCARNEEQRIDKCLSSLLLQSHPPEKIVVVNDGSTDLTKAVAGSFPHVTVLDLPYHSDSHAGTFKMAMKFNAGFDEINNLLFDDDFLLIVGSDDEFPRDYIEQVITRMRIGRTSCHGEVERVVVASGQVEGEHTEVTAPRGGGRIIRGWFWKRYLNGHYPEGWAWEDYINYRAMKEGFLTRCYNEIKFRRLRSEKRTWKKAIGDGKSMYALGYHWKHALGRSVRMFPHSPKLALAQFVGWSLHRDVTRLDCADRLNEVQKKSFRKNVWNVLRGKPRKTYIMSDLK